MRFELNKTIAIVLVVLAALFTFSAPRALAADSKAEKARLRERSEARYQEIRKLKSNGTVWDPLESTCRHASLSIL